MSKTPLLDAVMQIRHAILSAGIHPQDLEKARVLLPRHACLMLKNSVSAELGDLLYEKSDLGLYEFKLAGITFDADPRQPFVPQVKPNFHRRHLSTKELIRSGETESE